ncbi:hypothetical protein WH47_12475 [Habropoda laboriosa]|uniref:N-acetyltransferase domain-containing protein n=1 Tax=Habropoda laboriosa TaxID=597456 RepID=A0A0L7QZZ9_9HYME|nr:hypothetical protein WH47_12475 [Habropoda laboriosa]
MKMMMERTAIKIESMLSFCALEEGTDEFVGVLIATIFEKSQWYLKREQGETLRQVRKLKLHAIAKANFFNTIDADKSLCIDILCVKPDHQKKGIGTALLRSCIARASNIASACVGQFTSNAAQTIAKRLHFEVIYELPYKELEFENVRFQPFEECHPKNYSIACMALRISPPQLPIPPPPSLSTIIPRSTSKKKNAKKKK